jgi:hypothetical protein
VSSTCELSLECRTVAGDWSGIHVYWEGMEIPQDRTHTEGWDFTDPDMTVVQFYGQACVQLTSGPATVTVSPRCFLP